MLQLAATKATNFNVSKTFLCSSKDAKDLHMAAITMSIFAFFANEISMFAFREARDMVKKSSLYKFEVKKFINETERNLISCEQNMMKHLNKEYFEEYAIAGTSALYEDIKKLHYSIELVLNREYVKYANILAWCETSRSLLEYACYVYDTAIEELNIKFGRNYRNILSDFRPTSALKSLTNVCNILMKGVKVDISQDKLVRMAFQVIENKFTNEKIISQCVDDACKYTVGGDVERKKFQSIKWNEYMLDTLRNRFGKVSVKEISEHLCISVSSVYRKAKELGLNKSK